MADTTRMQLLIVSALLLLGTLASLPFRARVGQVMTSEAMESWFLTACYFFYALFSLVGVSSSLVSVCRNALTVFLVGIAVYLLLNMSAIVSRVSTIIFVTVVLIIYLVIVSPLAAHMMQLRLTKHERPTCDRGSRSQKIAGVGRSLAAKFKKAK